MARRPRSLGAPGQLPGVDLHAQSRGALRGARRPPGLPGRHQPSAPSPQIFHSPKSSTTSPELKDDLHIERQVRRRAGRRHRGAPDRRGERSDGLHARAPTRPRPAAARFSILRHPATSANGSDTYAAALDIIAWADDLGFERVAFRRASSIPIDWLPVVSARLRGGGRRDHQSHPHPYLHLARILYDPLRLAEEVAVTDLCTQVASISRSVSLRRRRLRRLREPTTTVVAATSTNWSRSCDTRGPASPSNIEARLCERPLDRCRIPCRSISAAELRARSIAGPPASPMASSARHGWPWEAYRKACSRAGKSRSAACGRQRPIFLWGHDRGHGRCVGAARAPHPPPDRLLRTMDTSWPWQSDGSVHPDGRSRQPQTGRRLPGAHA